MYLIFFNKISYIYAQIHKPINFFQEI